MRESRFIQFNIENILKNCIQAEDHLRHLVNVESDEPGHNSCVHKHLLFVEGEADEAISHSAHVLPEKTNLFASISDRVRGIRKKLDMQPVQESIKEVREIRKMVEEAEPKYNTSKCKACSFHSNEEKIYKLQNHNTISNSKNDDEVSRMVSTEQLGYLALGNVGGKIVQEGVGMLSAQYPMVGPVKTDDLVSIVAGAGLTYYGVKMARDDKVGLAATAAGLNVLVDKGVSILKGFLGMGMSMPRMSYAPIAVSSAPYIESPMTAVIGAESPLLL